MQYDQSTDNEDVVAGLEANSRISAETLAAIESLLGLSEGGTTNVGLMDAEGNLISPNPDESPDMIIVNAPGESDDGPLEFNFGAGFENTHAYILDTDQDVNATWNTVERVIVSGNGDDNLTVNGDMATTIDGADGNDTIETTGGDDSVSGGLGDDSITTGTGDDTVDGGEGYDELVVAGSINDYEVVIEDGQLVLIGADSSYTVSNVEFIQLDDSSIAVAGNETDADTLSLYQGLLGRSADKEGAQYWLGDIDQGADVVGTANAFMHTAEGSYLLDMSDDEFVATLYENALGREGDSTELGYWADDLANGASRADVAVAIIGSDEADANIVNVQLLDGLV